MWGRRGHGRGQSWNRGRNQQPRRERPSGQPHSRGQQSHYDQESPYRNNNQSTSKQGPYRKQVWRKKAGPISPTLAKKLPLPEFGIKQPPSKIFHSDLFTNLDDSSDEEDIKKWSKVPFEQQEDTHAYDFEGMKEDFFKSNPKLKRLNAEPSFLVHALSIRLFYLQRVNAVYYDLKKLHLNNADQDFISFDKLNIWLTEVIKRTLKLITNLVNINPPTKDISLLTKEIVSELVSKNYNIRKILKFMHRRQHDFLFMEILKYFHKASKKNQQYAIESYAHKSSNRKKPIPKIETTDGTSNFYSSMFEVYSNNTNTEKNYTNHHLYDRNKRKFIRAYLADCKENNTKKESWALLLKGVCENNGILSIITKPKDDTEKVFLDILIYYLHAFFPGMKRNTLAYNDIINIMNGYSYLARIRLVLRSLARGGRNLLDDPLHGKLLYAINDGSRKHTSTTSIIIFGKGNTANTAETTTLFMKLTGPQYHKLAQDIESSKLRNYSAIYTKLETLFPALKNPCSITLTRQIAEAIRGIIKNDLTRLVYFKHDKQKRFLIDLAHLLFGVEGARNPAILILNQMILDLLIIGKITWFQVFVNSNKNEPLMPTAFSGALSASRKLQGIYNSHMPYSHIFPGSSEQQESASHKKLIESENKVIELWSKCFSNDLSNANKHKELWKHIKACYFKKSLGTTRDYVIKYRKNISREFPYQNFAEKKYLRLNRHHVDFESLISLDRKKFIGDFLLKKEKNELTLSSSLKEKLTNEIVFSAFAYYYNYSQKDDFDENTFLSCLLNLTCSRVEKKHSNKKHLFKIIKKFIANEKETFTEENPVFPEISSKKKAKSKPKFFMLILEAYNNYKTQNSCPSDLAENIIALCEKKFELYVIHKYRSKFSNGIKINPFLKFSIIDCIAVYRSTNIKIYYLKDNSTNELVLARKTFADSSSTITILFNIFNQMDLLLDTKTLEKFLYIKKLKENDSTPDLPDTSPHKNKSPAL